MTFQAQGRKIAQFNQIWELLVRLLYFLAGYPAIRKRWKVLLMERNLAKAVAMANHVAAKEAESSLRAAQLSAQVSNRTLREAQSLIMYQEQTIKELEVKLKPFKMDRKRDSRGHWLKDLPRD